MERLRVSPATRGQARGRPKGARGSRSSCRLWMGREVDSGSGRSTECSRGLGGATKAQGRGLCRVGLRDGLLVKPRGSEGLSPSSPLWSLLGKRRRWTSDGLRPGSPRWMWDGCEAERGRVLHKSKRRLISPCRGSEETPWAAGGILVCWDKRSLEVMETEVGNSQSLDCLWEELGAIRGLWEEPWCLGGTSMFILSQRERSRQGRLSGAMRSFAQTVDDLELIDLPMQGGIATWSGGRNNQSWARLDRFLVTQQWLDMFSGGPTPFRFENMWLKVDDFKGLLRGGGKGLSIWSTGMEWRVRVPTIAEAEQKKEAKDAFHKWVLMEEFIGGRNLGSSADRGSRGEGGIVNAFQKLLSEERGGERILRGCSSNNLIPGKLKLEVPFSEEEIHFALMEMRGDKAPGPDGSQWPFGKIAGICQVLANRLKKVLDGVVSVDQNAFVRGTQILDASLVANEDAGERGEELIVSHLLFADDTLIFCKARREQLANLSWILAWFEAASGLRINLAKSVLIPVGEVDEMEELATELGCRLGALPTVYLGLPLGAHHKTSSSWDGVEERMRRRLAHPKEEGGLGIRKIDLLNKALLGKWVWRYAYEKDNLWKKAIGVKYGQEGCGWRTKEVCGPYGVGLWKEIMKEADWCWESMGFKLFTLAGQKNAKVCEVWDSSLGQEGWNLSLARDFNDWEMDQIGEMLNLLKDIRISSEEDAVRWKREGNGVFWGQGAYKSLSGYSTGVFPNRRIWMDKVPTKVSFFAWEASWGKILTLDKLQKRGWQLPNRAIYALGRGKCESYSLILYSG
ncbi:hypothetical protein CK203_061456 [Vitis vinifera]|uniref:Reverse transcriptase zinc-binding domain-containing protein n=1 Tax=Vitis vinifera TaxID=29760 RepID=A0A438FKK3_VITVI|nr:hypothetical protein CK203_061456 [Vitis vinifera]